jgi:hypothetical protein
MNEVYASETKKVNGIESWRVSEALSCIVNAKKAMKNPALMKAVKELAKKRLEDEKAEVEQLKALAGK